MVKEDCFAFKTFRNGIKTCAVLKELLCKEKECSFYKTSEEYVKGFEGYPDYRMLCHKYKVEPKK